MRLALKEWAVICRALGEGRQVFVLRKGGIADGDFDLPDTRFWLYPTYVHQQRMGLVEAAALALAQVETERPEEGTARIALWAEASGIYQVRQLDKLLSLEGMHWWSQETVSQRFHYRREELAVLTLRVHRLERAIELEEKPAYAGCRSWVHLDHDLGEPASQPVLDDDAFRVQIRRLESILDPVALA
jgi:hypothetical protein